LPPVLIARRLRQKNAPHFDSEHYLTGDWFGLRNKLYDWGVEITGWLHD
jgi:hypothetical protein